MDKVLHVSIYPSIYFDFFSWNRNTSIPNTQNVEKCDCQSEPGPTFSLKTFKKYADIFKSQYFSYKDNKKIIGSNIKYTSAVGTICEEY